jgi:hypothetical protein
MIADFDLAGARPYYDWTYPARRTRVTAPLVIDSSDIRTNARHLCSQPIN